MRVEASLAAVQYETCTEPTVLLVGSLTGEISIEESLILNYGGITIYQHLSVLVISNYLC